MRRGQVTLFVIIGLILLITIVFLFLLRRAILDDVGGGAGATYETAKVESFVGSCIDLVTEEGVTLLGKQGGLIFTDQGGLHTRDAKTLEAQNKRPTSPETHFDSTLDWPVYQLDDGRRPWYGHLQPAPHDFISFGLVLNSSSLFSPPIDCRPCPTCTPACTTRITAPGYPWANTWGNLNVLTGKNSPLADYMKSATMTERNAEGPFGDYTLPRLCDPEGPNANTIENKNLRCREIDDAPEKLHGPSIQKSLTTYIERMLPLCLDKDRLGENIGASVSIGEPTASVVFSMNRLTVLVSLPLTFTRENSVRIGQFTRTYDIRLFKLYRYIYFLLKAVSKDPHARIADPAFYTRVRGYDGFVVNQQRLPFPAVHRNDLFLVAVTDPYSIVKQSSLTFRFLIENRPPILDNYHGVLSLLPYENKPFPWIVPISVLDPDGDKVDVRLDFPSRPVYNHNIPPFDEYPLDGPSTVVGGWTFPKAYDLRGIHPIDIKGIQCPPPAEGPCLLINEVPANVSIPYVRLVVNDTKPIGYPTRRDDLLYGQDWEIVTLEINDTHS